MCLGWVLSVACCTSVLQASTHDLERDYSATSNPAGVWSYGWKGTTGGVFNLLTYHGYSGGLDFWLKDASGPASVYHNGSTETLYGIPAGTVWFGPGVEGHPDNFGTIRFTVPTGRGGEYRVESKVETFTGDTDFHVVKNGIELFGVSLAGSAPPTQYSNLVSLAAGDTVDFMIGRGADGLEYGSGLKIKAFLTLLETTNAPPTITTQPQSQTVNQGADVEFSVVAEGDEPLSYQWRLNGNPISGATNSTLLLTHVQITQAGGYSVVVADIDGSVESSTATLQVIPSGTYDLEADYSAMANPAGTWSYGWKGTLGGTFNLFTYHAFDSGLDFWLKDPYGPSSVYHNPTTNTLFGFAPGTVWFGPGVEGNSDNFGVIRFTVPSGAGGVYQVRSTVEPFTANAGDTDFHIVKNGAELYGVFLAGSAPPNGYTNTVSLAAGDHIDFMVGRGADGHESGSALKIKAHLTLLDTSNAPPSIVHQPQSQTVTEGDDVEFSVVAEGDGPLGYQWRFNGDDISGATSATLSLENVQAAQAGSYSVLVSGPSGSTESTAAALQVIVPPPSGTHDLERDYSQTANPAGVWSYGWKGTIGGEFHLFTYHGYSAGLDFWLKDPYGPSSVYHNPTTNTLFGFAPGTVWFGPGVEGHGDNFGVIRFTVPSEGSGVYRVTSRVDPLSGDTDFHVMKNGDEMFGIFLAANGAPNTYSNVVRLAAGDTVDFVIGRGADGRESGSGLKIKAFLSLLDTTNVPPTIVHQPESQTATIGSSIEFSVVAEGDAPLSYQWRFNGTDIPDATSVTLSLPDVQAVQAGSYSVLVSNSAGSVESIVATLQVITPPPAGTYDLERDYSTNANPAGLWSYGWKGSLSGPFNLFTYHGYSGGVDFWLKDPSGPASVYHNPTTNMLYGFGPGVVWFGPGVEGYPDNFGVIRFTVPAAADGVYRLESRVESLVGDTDFHVLKNAGEMYGIFLPGHAAPTSYTHNLRLAAGDTIDFTIGRGADGREYGSGLKIKAYLTLLDTTNVPPSILSQPQSQTVSAGGTVEFSVVAEGDAPLAYQWRHDGTDVSSATSATLTLQNVQSADAGSYSVLVSNPAGSVESVSATLHVVPPVEPGTYDLERDYATNSNPAGPWSYGWKGTIGGDFHLFTFHDFNSGMDYWLKDPYGPSSVYHNPSPETVYGFPPGTVWFGPGVEGHPDNFGAIRFTVPNGAAGVYEVFSRVEPFMAGAGDTDFHIAKNGAEIFGTFLEGNAQPQTNRHVLQLAAGNTVDFLIGRGADQMESGSALKIKVAISLLDTTNVPPTIVQQPQGQIVNVGDTAQFTVAAEGDAPLSYQWRFNGADIDGATGTTLVIENAQLSHAGNYSVSVSNPAGSVLSSPATLNVIPPPSGNYDLEADYSSAHNPAGMWSFGWKGTLDGEFTLLPFHGENRGFDYWLKTPGGPAAVYHNGTTETLYGFAPGTVWFGPGVDGAPDNFCAIRFTVPNGCAGTYTVESVVQPFIAGAGDSDFHVLKNGTELFTFSFDGYAPPVTFSNTLELAVGDTIDFLVGRGADGQEYASALKIKAFISLVESGQGGAHARIDLLSQLLLSDDQVHPYAIAADGQDAVVTLQASLPPTAASGVSPQSITDSSAVIYTWFANGNDTPFSQGAVTTAKAAVGTHKVTVVVSGAASSRSTLTFHVITPGDAVSAVLQGLKKCQLPHQKERPLAAALVAAIQAFDRGDTAGALQTLEAFQEKTLRSIGSSAPAHASTLINAADKVIGALTP